MKNKSILSVETILINIIGLVFVWWVNSQSFQGLFSGMEESFSVILLVGFLTFIHLFSFDTFRRKFQVGLLDFVPLLVWSFALIGKGDASFLAFLAIFYLGFATLVASLNFLIIKFLDFFKVDSGFFKLNISKEIVFVILIVIHIALSFFFSCSGYVESEMLIAGEIVRGNDLCGGLLQRIVFLPFDMELLFMWVANWALFYLVSCVVGSVWRKFKR